MPRLLAALLASLPLSVLAQALDRVEPPFWWAGMKDTHLQLMVHGQDIATLAPRIAYPGVTLRSVTQVSNRNYVFIDLDVTPEAKPGAFDIRFEGKRALTYRYQLLARQPGSAERQGFSPRDAIYQVMPDRWANGDPSNDTVPGMPDKFSRVDGGRHGGDIQGMIDHLGYIEQLGFTQLWPTPLVENNMPGYSYHGYAATDFYKIDARYGRNEDYVRLSSEARKHGIGIIQDVVLNHIGSGHWWMRDMPMPDWLNYGGKFVPTGHQRMTLQDPYASRQDSANFTQGWFVQSMPDMNQANPLVANYLTQNSIWWIEYAGLAGLRIDTFSYSDPRFLSEYTRRITQEYPHLNMVGEEWSKYPTVVARWQQDKQNFDGYRAYMPSMMDFPLNEAVRTSLGEAKESLTPMYEVLSMDYLYPHPEQLVLFEGNHDMARTFSVLHVDVGLWKMAMIHLMTAPRIPQFYYGSEILMTSATGERNDNSYRHDFPGGWAGDAVNAFTGAGLTPRQREAQEFIRKLTTWRKTATAVHGGRTTHFAPENNTYVMFRWDEKHKLMVAFNKNDKAVALPLARFGEMLGGVRAGTDVLTGQRHELTRELQLPAKSALILDLTQ
ncbi:alpha-amlyase [Massilia arenosa]|uniref:Alpha-amlyase n=2 Tax=Zemynaea arenosa TaxID=2561931 RepID=A0A4Y9SRG9_9BURK|nr:alpha-amlyase [Massilia arenosa]